jgi:16S rRNA (cytidine1402-2'-O)-methyltransferase
LSSLVLVTLPIGNLKDITIRALEALKSGVYFYAEDTRVFKKLLEGLEIDYSGKHIDSFHDHSEGKIPHIIEKLNSGADVYLVSDAGSPMISDPAYPIVRKVVELGLDLKTIPGVTSVVTALELSGLPPHPFHFWGFIARTKNEKMNFFSELASIVGTHVFFESPHRIYETIEQFFEALPEGELVVTRELTKVYESVNRIKRDDLIKLQSLVLDKGEFVVLFHNDKKKSSSMNELSAMVTDYLEGKPGTKKLAKIFAKILDQDQKNIYDQLVRSGKE